LIESNALEKLRGSYFVREVGRGLSTAPIPRPHTQAQNAQM
jgi:hypothetical protein